MTEAQTEKQTCMRRMSEFGPWERAQNLDEWKFRDGHRYCSFCGSCHPDDALSRLKDGEEAGPTDKNYKMYLGSRDKVYFQHFSEEQMKAFIELYNSKAMKVGYPGYFYNPPFFMRYREEA